MISFLFLDEWRGDAGKDDGCTARCQDEQEFRVGKEAHGPGPYNS